MPKGSYDRPSLVGEQYGELTVISFAYIKRKQRCWNCICSCNKMVIVKTSQLKKRETVSCGHLKKRYAWRGHGEISGCYWGNIRRGAKVRDLDFNVSIETAWEIFLAQKGNCAYTNWPLTFAENLKKNPENQTASLDRIDNNKGYVPGNVQWVHKKINLMKLTMTDREFIEVCNAVSSNSPQ